MTFVRNGTVRYRGSNVLTQSLVAQLHVYVSTLVIRL